MVVFESMHELNIFWVDILVAAVVIVSTIIAALRGFVREVLSILAWAAAVAAAIWFGPSASVFLHAHISTPFVAPVLAYAGIFLAVLIPLGIASHYIAQFVRRSPVSTADRILGVPFGIVRGLAVIGLAYFAFSLVVPQTRSLHGSQSAAFAGHSRIERCDCFSAAGSRTFQIRAG